MSMLGIKHRAGCGRGPRTPKETAQGRVESGEAVFREEGDRAQCQKALAVNAWIWEAVRRPKRQMLGIVRMGQVC